MFPPGILTEGTSPSGAAVRYGREKFAVSFPSLPSADTVTLAETLRKNVASLEIEFDRKASFCITIRLGVATYDGFGFFQKSEFLIRAADSAGRNCVWAFVPKYAA